jgi:hypothetical protein
MRSTPLIIRRGHRARPLQHFAEQSIVLGRPAHFIEKVPISRVVEQIAEQRIAI